MTQTFTHEPLSGSTNGLGVKVAATVTVGTTVHTAVAGVTSRDEVWLFAQNQNAGGTTRVLTIEFGGVASPDNLIVLPILARDGPVPIIPGFPLRNGLVVTAFADVANEVIIYGYINRITVA